MKIAVVFPRMLVAGRPLDFHNLMTDPRGTTGSEIMTLAFAAELADRGHDVDLLIENPNASVLRLREATKYASVKPFSQTALEVGYDVVAVALDVNILRRVPASTLRVCLQQLNDFEYAQPGFDAFVDLYVVPSDDLRRHLADKWPVTPSKWRVVPNGCHLDMYPSIISTRWEEHDGSCAYTSSPDRGLHHVVSQWPIIKAAVSHARLRIYYYALDKWLSGWRGRTTEGLHPVDVKQCENAQFVDRVLPTLQDVEVVGSVSRQKMAEELSRTELLLYPADCVKYSEGFSCSTLEGCASGALPILIGSDALGSVYRSACPVIEAPARENLWRWTRTVIHALKNPKWTAQRRTRSRAFANNHDWRALAEQLETVLVEVLWLRRKDTPEVQTETKPMTDVLTKELSFRGHPYKIAYVDRIHTDPSWYSFEDESVVRDRTWDIRPGEIVFDVGAAYGSYTLTALACGAAFVYAWSPEAHPGGGPSEADLLEQSLKLNGWSDQCRVFPDIGCYSSRGTINTFTLKFEPDTMVEKTDGNRIAVSTFDEQILPRVVIRKDRSYVMKLDVEGAEVEVLKGAEQFILQARPRIQVENHQFKDASIEQRVRDWLTARGYLEVSTYPYGSVSHSLYVPTPA